MAAGHEHGKEKAELKKSDLPPIVLSSFEKAYPKACIKEVEKENINGTEYFGIEGKNKTWFFCCGGTKFEVLYAPDGVLYETRSKICADKLPEVVRKSMAEKYPGSKIHRAETIVRGTVTEYELKIKTGKEKVELLVGTDGTVIKIEAADKHEEKGDK
jgi:hypothetical protein